MLIIQLRPLAGLLEILDVINPVKPRVHVNTLLRHRKHSISALQNQFVIAVTEKSILNLHIIRSQEIQPVIEIQSSLIFQHIVYVGTIAL
jgi:hypothetical protein